MSAAALSVRLDPLSVSLLSLLGFVAVLALYLAQRERLEALARVSILDPLTGLVGGRYLDAELWPARVRGSAPLAVLYVDLDGLKRRNDCFGHAAGDRLIVQAAGVLRACVRRGSDDVVRLHTAGDEFLIVLACPSLERAERIAATLLERLRAVSISASIGVAFTARAEHAPRAALRERAEAALRAAKRDGGGRYAVAAPEADPDETQRLEIAAADGQAVPVFIDETADPTLPYSAGLAARLTRSAEGV
ncbi:MAG: GGDEF domain-containing protein [Polyangia bacterium]